MNFFEDMIVDFFQGSDHEYFQGYDGKCFKFFFQEFDSGFHKVCSSI